MRINPKVWLAQIVLIVTLLLPTQLVKAQFAASQTWVVAANVSGNANNPALLGLPVGQMNDVLGVPIKFIPIFNNTGATTITIISGTPVAMRKLLPNGTLAAFTGNEFQVGVAVTIMYDGTNFDMLSPVQPPSPTTCAGFGGTCPAAAGSGTYTTPANVLWIEIYGIGGGGGGSAATAGPSGGAGGNTCWNTTGSACTSPLYQSTGGGGGANPSGGAAGVCTGGSATPNLIVPGSLGGNNISPVTNSVGSGGAPSYYGGPAFGWAQPSSTAFGAGGSGVANGGSLSDTGPGGGSACLFYAIVSNPAASYTYTVGAAGTGGGSAGNGGRGNIFVIEHYGS